MTKTIRWQSIYWAFTGSTILYNLDKNNLMNPMTCRYSVICKKQLCGWRKTLQSTPDNSNLQGK